MSFDPNKDYYGILGVTPTAEMAVIKAAYKALAGIYHPDRNPSHDAKIKMQSINEAWSVLSKESTKAEYDSTLDDRRPEGDFSSDYEDDDIINEYFREDWSLAVSFYPDLDGLAFRLSKISKRLEIAFKAYLLIEKNFVDRKFLAQTMENNFLQRYFGSNKKILSLVDALIFDVSNKKLLRDLNAAISVLGTTDADPIVLRFQREIDLIKLSKVHDFEKKMQAQKDDLETKMKSASIIKFQHVLWASCFLFVLVIYNLVLNQ
jgi:curved DNA-binding protein CbpA